VKKSPYNFLTFLDAENSVNQILSFLKIASKETNNTLAQNALKETLLKELPTINKFLTNCSSIARDEFVCSKNNIDIL
jgi:hypothetical protein